MSRIRAGTVPYRFGAAGFHRAVGEEQVWSWLKSGIGRAGGIWLEELEAELEHGADLLALEMHW